MKKLAEQYPNANKIRLVQDNLNTHNSGSFYENLPADEAFELAQRFEFYYTPKSVSWLNMIETVRRCDRVFSLVKTMPESKNTNTRITRKGNINYCQGT